MISVHDSLLGLFSALFFKYQNNYMNIDLVKTRFKCENYILKNVYYMYIKFKSSFFVFLLFLKAMF